MFERGSLITGLLGLLIPLPGIVTSVLPSSVSILPGRFSLVFNLGGDMFISVGGCEEGMNMLQSNSNGAFIQGVCVGEG